MRKNLLRSFCLIIIVLMNFGCKKSSDHYLTIPWLSAYLPLTTGKYIIYRTDSTVFTNFGRNTEIHSYEEMQLVDSPITDAMGRTGYRVYRFIRDTSETQPWSSTGTLFIVPAQNTIEAIEDNMRVIKLDLPVAKGNSWNGNRYLPDQPYSDTYNFSNDDAMSSSDWNYTYSSLDTTLILNGKTI